MKNPNHFAIYHRDELQCLFTDSRISNEMILTYLYLKTYDIKKTCIVWPSVDTIAADLDIGKNNVFSMLKKLENNLMIKKIKQTEDKANNSYQINYKYNYVEKDGKLFLASGFSKITKQQIVELRNRTKIANILTKDIIYEGVVVKKKSTKEEIKEIQKLRDSNISKPSLKLLLVMKTYGGRFLWNRDKNRILTGGTKTKAGANKRFRDCTIDCEALAEIAQQFELPECSITWFLSEARRVQYQEIDDELIEIDRDLILEHSGVKSDPITPSGVKSDPQCGVKSDPQKWCEIRSPSGVKSDPKMIFKDEFPEEGKKEDFKDMKMISPTEIASNPYQSQFKSGLDPMTVLQDLANGLMEARLWNASGKWDMDQKAYIWSQIQSVFRKLNESEILAMLVNNRSKIIMGCKILFNHRITLKKLIDLNEISSKKETFLETILNRRVDGISDISGLKEGSSLLPDERNKSIDTDAVNALLNLDI